MVHSKKLEETALWKEYVKKSNTETKRHMWVKEVYAYAANYLKDVRVTFGNYTLHDETHILNVLDAMGGLLGDQINILSVGELELLILVASLHDVGMVYTDEEKQTQFEDVETCKKFLKENAPELLGSSAKDWSEDMQQNYLRSLHSERVAEVLQNKSWRELMYDQRPIEVVPLDCIILVCEAHGYNPSDMMNNQEFEYMQADDVSPLFCAILLRLADLLDFDDTRAPQVLYSYVECNENSCEEWKKHQASAGFVYPEFPSTEDLPYKARCKSPGVEHAVRTFLDWVDVELGNSIRLQKYCEKDWQQKFSFPRAVSRKEIQSEGYMSGDFCITMDQTKILDLLTGENLYDNRDVFVRELLQNAIDATLLRAKMDADFVPEKSRIDFWEWNDKDGNIWFRIDDEGTGMTMGMLQRYFLKVGNSYYSSKEIERDLRDHNQTEKYHSISRFGIGFLSCFLSGDYAEVSTLYFDSDKNCREEENVNSKLKKHYGLRLQVTGLSGYYTLLNQFKNHLVKDEMPNPGGDNSQVSYKNENAGYRTKAGTSIAIRLNPGKLGTINLRETVEKYLCGARVPVYYNNERIGQTYEEVMKAAHDVAGEMTYELTDEMKKRFDQVFPKMNGKYPKIVVTTIPLDTEEDGVLQGVSGVFEKYDVRFEETPSWQVKNLKYSIKATFAGRGKEIMLFLNSEREEKYNMVTNYLWNDIKRKYDKNVINSLEEIFEKCTVYPPSEKELGEVWKSFGTEMDLSEIWKVYHDYTQQRNLCVSLEQCGRGNNMCFEDEVIKCAYQGVYVGELSETFMAAEKIRWGMIFLENEWRPMIKASRSKVTWLPIEVGLYIYSIANKYGMADLWRDLRELKEFWDKYTQKDWKNVDNKQLRQWIECNQKNEFEKRKKFLEEPIQSQRSDYGIYIDVRNELGILNLYQNVYLNEHYYMEIDYDNGQSITFYESGNCSNEALNLFPPMLFCEAANDISSKYLCSAQPYNRKGITLNHHFMVWLMKHAYLLDKYFPRQFEQIKNLLMEEYDTDIISEVNEIRQQLISLPERHGIDVAGFLQLSREDFWYAEDDE